MSAGSTPSNPARPSSHPTDLSGVAAHASWRACRTLTLVAIAGVALFASGCASYSAKELPEVRNFPNSRQFDDFSYGSEIPSSEVEIRSHFDRNLLECGVLPVFVYLRSTSDTADFEIDPDSIRLVTADETELMQIDPDEAYDRCRFSHARALPMYLLFPFCFINHGLISGANGRMQEDFHKKHLEKQTLIRKTAPARDGVVGVLYFSPADKDDEIDIDRILNGGYLSMQVVRYVGSDADPAEDLRILFSQ